MAFLLTVITFLLFAPAIGYQFINYDDGLYVYENPHVLHGLTGSGLAYAFTTFDFGNWMPVTWISLMLDTTLFGTRPAGYHLTAVALHSLSAALLFLALHRMTKSFWRSALVAAIFAFHPLRQESVAWVAERKGGLSTFFWMLGLLAYARYAEQRTLKRYLLVALCLLLGLAAKPMLITFPAALLLLDFWPLGRLGSTGAEMRAKLWPLVREKIPLFAVCVVMVGITYGAQKKAGAVGATPPTLGQKLVRVTDNYGFYLRKTVWPAGLAIPYAKARPAAWLSLVNVAVLAGITLVGLWRWRRSPWLATGWFWFLGTFAPVVGWLQISQVYVADRYTYIPSIGLGIAVAWGLAALAEHRPQLQRFTVGLGALLCVAATIANEVTLARWTDPVTLFTDSVSKSPHPTACNNLASALTSRGRFEEAVRYATQAIGLTPEVAGAYNTRGMAYNGMGDYAAAIRDYSEALARDPELVAAWNNRGCSRINLGELEPAAADFDQAVKLDPQFSEAWNNRAFIAFSRSNYSAALESCTRAMEINPRSASACNNRARVLVAMKQYDRARADIERCRQLGGEPDAEVLQALAKATGKTE